MSARIPLRIACYALTTRGVELVRTLAPLLGAPASIDCFVPERMAKNSEHGFCLLHQAVAQNFHRYQAHIFVAAAGIVVRSIAPHLNHKSTDPCVVVCDQKGQFAISLLAGHWGGGNALARQVAQALEGTVVITTATDTEELPSLDTIAQQAGCQIVDWDQVKNVNAALLAGQTVQVFDPLQALSLGHNPLFVPVKPPHIRKNVPTVSAHWRHVDAGQNLLRLAIPALHVGIGCRRNVPASDILHAVRTTLLDAGLEPLSISRLASVNAKQDEAGLLECARQLHVPLVFYSPEELSEVPSPTPSAMAAQIFGVDHISVCEGAALLSAGGEDSLLLLPKA
ncbi:MAG: cobalamin biosynthesis protein, partial [Desulfovibrionaceae bacterium]